MPRVIPLVDEGVISLDECAEALATSGFDPEDEESLAHGALMLRRLGNNRAFLGDMLLDELARHAHEVQDDNAYGPMVVMLARPAGGQCFLRANIWPGETDAMLRDSGSSAFLYGLPHNHNFHFLTLGYFGPGYWSDYYELDAEAAVGWAGEPVDMKHIGKYRLEEGKIQLYRAHVDVHAQLAADALSVSVNILHTNTQQGWLDQYHLDTDNQRIAGILNHGTSEAFLRIAVGLGGEEARDLAHRFGAGHPSDRMRLHAWDALASVANDDAARDALWARAEGAGSRLVAMEAKTRRAALVG